MCAGARNGVFTRATIIATMETSEVGVSIEGRAGAGVEWCDDPATLMVTSRLH